jgi:biopolymer transport protein ExbD
METTGAGSENINGINITPLVDVSLVLVLIFMVTMPLAMIHGIDVKRQILKRYGLSTPQESVTVRLTARGIFVKDEKGRDQSVPYDEFGMVLGQMIGVSSSRRVLLQADRDVPHGQTVWVLDLAKQNGAGDVSLLE